MRSPVETWASPYLAAQAAYLRHLGTAPVADVIEHDGIYAVRTGVFSNTENGVVSAGASPVVPNVARDLMRWFNERNVPASWLCSEGEGRAGTSAALQAVGCRSGGSLVLPPHVSTLVRWPEPGCPASPGLRSHP
jgi:hypothetical protein